MAITLRSEKGSPLTHTELDQNFKELFYSSSISGSTVTLHKYNSSGSTIPVLSLPTTGSVQEIDSRLDGKIDIVKEEILSEINTLENAINSANINQETTATASGVNTVALPKTAANTGMQVQLFGQSATEEISNSSIDSHFELTVLKTQGQPIYTATVNSNEITRFGFDISKSVVVGEKYYARLKVKLNTGTCTAIDLLLRDSTSDPSNSIILHTINNPVLNTTYTLSGLGTLTSGLTGLVRFGSRAFAPISGNIIEYIQPLLINLTATFGAGNEPTKEQCDVLFANYFEGSDNVLGTGRVRSVGKNLFDYSNILKGFFISGTDGTLVSSANDFASTLFILCNPSTNYTLSSKSGAITFRVAWYDSNKNFISRSVLTDTLFTVSSPANARYMRFSGVTSQAEKWQVERASTATTYEPHRQSILQLTTPPLRSNGLIKDEIRKGANGYELVKRVGVGALGANGITGGDFEGGLIGTKISSDEVSTWTLNTVNPISGTKDGRLQVTTIGTNDTRPILNISLARSSGQLRKISFSYKVNSGSCVLYGYHKGNSIVNINTALTGTGILSQYYICDGPVALNLYFNGRSLFDVQIDNVKDELIAAVGLTTSTSVTELGSNIHYTLATPTITPIAHAGLLNSNSNGTAYFEPIIADAGVYASNITVQLTDYPISSFESIRKYANGTYTELNTATAVIASGGLSFTHPDLVSGDLVMFTYAYNRESIGRSIIFTYPISNSNPYYNVTNSVPLTSGYYTSTTARAAVPEGVRKTGLILTYETAAGVWYTERYIGTATDTTSFTNAANWEVGVLRIASVTDTTEYAEITI